MSAAAVSSSQRWNARLLVARGVAIELVRRKEPYVLLILTMLYVAGMAVVGLVGIENRSTLLFLMNLGLTLAWFFGHLLAIITAARQFPAEFENRTILPLLATPADRGDVLIGKWLSSALGGVATFLLLFVLAWMPWLAFPDRPGLDGALLAQGVATVCASVAMSAALAIFLSFLVPVGVNLVLLGLLFFVGPAAWGVFAGESSAAAWLGGYLPDFAKLNLFNRYTDGVGALGAGEFLGLLLYATIVTTAALAASDIVFRRRAL